MTKKILIVEDEFVIADDLRIILEEAGFLVTGIVNSVKSALASIKLNKPDVVLLDIYLKGDQTGIDLATELKKDFIPFVYLSANSNQSVLELAKATAPDGFLVKPFREQDVIIALEIACYRNEHSMDSMFRKQKELKDRLLTLPEMADAPTRYLELTRCLQSFFSFDLISVIFSNDTGIQHAYLYRIGLDQYQFIGEKEFEIITKRKSVEILSLISNQPFTRETSVIKDIPALSGKNEWLQLLSTTFHLSSAIVCGMPDSRTGLFHLGLYSQQQNMFREADQFLLENAKDLLIKTFLPARSESLPSDNKDRNKAFAGILGTSPAFLSVLDLAVQVAPYDTSVLLTGESGTGKERIAELVQHLSKRSTKPFVKLNCAALPATLIESELFGHEKGAFTGATETRKGKFEQASGGTIFLDEITELPFDLQAKLLRVLQEKKVERIGSATPVNTDVRIIAATNRNLDQAIAENEFRLDLYYRLNVFPIHLPPLRERTGDISALATHIASKVSGRMFKKFNGFDADMLSGILHYSWPGNIRELENVIEQSVILNDGDSPLKLRQPLKGQNSSQKGYQPMARNTPQTFPEMKKTQQEAERETILKVLKETGGRIRGADGAAEKLHIKPTTLEARMYKLGINKEDLDH